MKQAHIIVIGGGPAGMMAAIRAGELKQRVTLIEKNPGLGRKLLLTGNGRCNITNACGLDSFLKRFSKNGQFLRDAFNAFSNMDLIEFFKDNGLTLKIEDQLRVFPETDKAISILEILKSRLHKNSVAILYNKKVTDILVDDKVVQGVLLSDKKVISSDKVIIAAGGLSYGCTGSTGDGFKIASRLGHKITPLRPGLVPLRIRQNYSNILKGITLKNIRLKLSDGETTISSDVGEVLFTHTGISGPSVLSLSRTVADWMYKNKDVYAELDLAPELSVHGLDELLLKKLSQMQNKSVKDILNGLMPRRMAILFLGILKLAPQKKVNQLKYKERKNIVSLIKGFRMDIAGACSFDEAMITCGGISLKDINPRTMESRLIRGLYFAGETIDVDADTGGFNLQAAFSTGYLAGESAAH